jgi:phosphoribosylformylglycinamidine synthase
MDRASAPPPFPGDLPLTPAVIRQHKINAEEHARILASLGREPTYTELGVFSVMWSEHCSYKSSRMHLRRLPTKGARVIQGPGENAGVVDIGDGFAAVFKMESHNHPSFIEPYQGAATGVGGILRDVFTMGARPIAGLNSLRFGSPTHPRTPELLRGVVHGVGGYGNAFGVPTVGGEVQFDARYDGNILVNAFTCGVARTDRIFYGRASGIGNPILYIGAKTGRDGIHGATMASDEFSETGPSQRPTMQVGDPFMGKLLVEACLELFQSDVLEGIQDMGAAGLTSSSVEMAGRADNGIELDLDRVPRRAKKMSPYEILLSESQERMLLVAKPGKEAECIAICKKWELDAAVIGRVTDTKRWVITATPDFDPLDATAAATARGKAQVVCDIPIGVLTDDAPIYDRPRTPKGEASPSTPLPRIEDWSQELLAMCGSPNLGSRQWVWRQYDSIVRGGTVVRPGSDAAVVRVPCEKDGKVIDKFLAFSVDCNGRWVDRDAFAGGAMAVAEACRNLVCSGAEPIGLTDCLNFGNPERPEVMEDLARAIDGIAAACNALAVPIVSGNVSLYNETGLPGGGSRAILPTPTIGAVGLFASPDDIVTQWFKRAGDVVVLLGLHTAATATLAGSEWCALHGASIAAKPSIDLESEVRLQRLVLDLARRRKLQSAHDVSDGGIAVALAEKCATAPDAESDVGARIDFEALGAVDEEAALLFGEAPTRVLVSTTPEALATVLEAARAAAVPALELGVTGGTTLSIALFPRAAAGRAGAPRGMAVHLEVAEIRARRDACLTPIVGA